MDKLEEIMASKRTALAERIRPIRPQELEQIAQSSKSSQTNISFHEAIATPEQLSVIAEIKRKSPSAGEIAAGINAEDPPACPRDNVCSHTCYIYRIYR